MTPNDAVVHSAIEQAEELQLASSHGKGCRILLGVQAGIYYHFKTSQFMLSYEIDDAVAGFELNNLFARGVYVRHHCANEFAPTFV